MTDAPLTAFAEMQRDHAEEPPSLRAYKRLSQTLRQGYLAAGSRLPSERALAERIGVNRSNLRHALRALADDGLLISARGSGWYVADRTVEEHGNDLLSFTEMARAKGLDASAMVLCHEIKSASVDEAEQLRVAPGAEVFHLRRVRMLEDTPIAVSSAFVPVQRAPGIDQHNFSTQSLYFVLENSYGISVRVCEYTLQAQPSDEKVMELLSVPQGSPMLDARWRSLDQRGLPVEIGRITYRGDRYRFQTKLVRHGARPFLDGREVSA